MKHKFQLVYIFLVFGIVLLGWGVFAKFSAAGIVVTPTITPNPTTNNQTMMLKHTIAYRHLSSDCSGGCHLDAEELVSVGRYLGGFVASWRNCDTWQFSGASAPYTMTCTDPNTEGAGKFVSAFGILISTEAGKFQLLMPLAGSDLDGRGKVVPGGWDLDDKMMWTAWDIVYEESVQSGDDPSATYSYDWAGYVGGGCVNSYNLGDLCGRVALEHNFILAPQP